MSADLYLWADSQNCIHVLSPEQHFELGLLEVPDSPSKNDQTRNNGIDAAGLLPASLWALLAAHYATEHGMTLMLDKSLPRPWHSLAWERLNWRGAKLGTFIKVVRYAQPATEQQKRSGETLIWDQWPGNEFKGVINQRQGIKRRFKHEQIEQDIQSGRDLGHFARLVIIAHGGENEATALLDKSGQAWDIELPATLPYEVLILACASYQGNFHDLAVACLERGARTVICGHGLLNAALIASALAVWLDTNGAAHETLWELQTQELPEPGGVHWLRYYGDAPVTNYDRLTVNFFQQPNQPNPVTELSKLVNEDNDDAIEAFLQDMKGSSTTYWPLTQFWLLPVVLYWAEKNSHALIALIKKRFDSLTVRCDELVPERAYGLAAMYRRQGSYPLAVAQLAEGLQCRTLKPQQEINLLGSLLNDLIDLNLPEFGRDIVDLLDDCLANFDDGRQAFRLLDRRARLALRQGDIDAALFSLQRKRQQVVEQGNEDIRELASLLYVSAWFDRPDVNSLAETALKKLPPIPDFGDGNDNHAYLLRALAVWQWRQQPAEDFLSAFLPACKKRLTLQDPGPYAFILVYQCLATGCYDNWQQAIAGLEQGRYWLELAAFHALAGKPKETRRALDKFHTLRYGSLQPLANQALYDIDWLAFDASQQAVENTILLAYDVTAASLARHGLLPL